MEIQGAPDVFLYASSDTHIVARGPNDELLQFFFPITLPTDPAGNRRHKADLTDLAIREGPGLDSVEDVLIAGDPHGNSLLSAQEGRGLQSVHIVARSHEDKLLEWSWNDRTTTWRVVSLTDYAVIEEEDRQEVGYPLIAGNPHYYSLGVNGTDTQHVVARSRDGMQLLEWSWNTIDQTWRVASLSGHRTMKVGEGVGNARIAGNPHGYSFNIFEGSDLQYNTARRGAKSRQSVAGMVLELP